VRRGRKVDSERKFFPGYVMVRANLTDDVFHLIKNTPKVTGFLGSDNKPVPITDKEADQILGQIQEGVERPKPSVSFEVGEQVRVSDGPFASFNGVVQSCRCPPGPATPSPPDRSRTWSARPQHHGILQGVQRQDPGDGKGCARSRS
jgi:hypothetical protein